MKRDFPISSSSFFQKMMQQTKNLLTDHLMTLQHKDPKFALKRFRSGGKKDQKNMRTLQETNLSQVYHLVKEKQVLGDCNNYSSIDWTEDSHSTINNPKNESKEEEEEKKSKSSPKLTPKRQSQKDSEDLSARRASTLKPILKKKIDQSYPD